MIKLAKTISGMPFVTATIPATCGLRYPRNAAMPSTPKVLVAVPAAAESTTLFVPL
jgi:hypothetical protein